MVSVKSISVVIWGQKWRGQCGNDPNDRYVYYCWFGFVRMDFSEQYHNEGDALDVRNDEKSISSKCGTDYIYSEICLKGHLYITNHCL